MKFELFGYNLNDILRTLNLKKIKIYNLKQHAKTHIEFEVEDKHIKKVKRIVVNVKTKTTPTKIKNIKKYVALNVGLLLGVFCGVISYLFMSNFTWQIVVYGTKDLSKKEIVTVLEYNGVKKGKINTETSEEIESILLNNYDKIAQVSVIREGTAIIINISEKLIYSEVEYKPIVASHSGIITSIEIVTGTNIVKVGDFVQAGDVLVLPYNTNKEGEKISVEPKAEITATMYVLGRTETSRTKTILKRTGKSVTTYKYRIFKLNFCGKKKNSFALFETEVYNENINGLVPFTRDVVIYHELKQVEVNCDFNLERTALEETSKQLAYKNLPIYQQMLKEETTTSVVDDKMISITTLTISGFIHD